ncbi:peptidylprolyl isomerase [Desulfococcus sp.]|uniref:peptidylprolyl isomerase n=1 Tax=Desulfococcus sp. TaxID=2025834 RepID=UPI003593E4A3
MRVSKIVILSILMGYLLVSIAAAAEKDAKKPEAPPEAKPAANAASKEEKPQNPVAAVVNGTKISRKALDRELTMVTQRMNSQGQQIGQEQFDKVRSNVLNNMIDRELLYQDALKNGIKVDSKAVDAQLDKMKKNFPGDDEYRKALEMMNTSEADLKANITQGMVIQQLIESKVTPQIQITDAQNKEFYDTHPELFKKPEQVKASHILIKAEPSAAEADKAAARKKIEEVQAKLKKGEKFDALAKQYSECPSSEKGGDLGYFSRGQMVKPFEDTAYAMKPGDVSDIVTTQFGYHLIQVTDKKPESTTAYDETKTKIGNHLKQEKMIEGVNAYIQKLKADAKIEVLL